MIAAASAAGAGLINRFCAAVARGRGATRRTPRERLCGLPHAHAG